MNTSKFFGFCGRTSFLQASARRVARGHGRLAVPSLFSSPASTRLPFSTHASVPLDTQISELKSAARKRYMRHPWLDEVTNSRTLPEDVRVLTFLAGNTAAGNLTDVERDWCHLDSTMHAAGMETILQSVIFAGVPKMLNAFQTVMELGVENRLIVEAEPKDGETYEAFAKAGEEVMKAAFLNKYKRLRERMFQLHPALDKWMVDTSYGRLRSRMGLAARERQLCALSALAGNIVWPQFRSSIIVALNNGCTLDEVRAILDQTEYIWGNKSQVVIDALWADLNKHSLSKWGIEEKTPIYPDVPQRNEYHNTYLSTEKHPYLYTNRLVDSIPDHLRVLALLAAHTCAGNLTRLSIDWSYLPEKYHQAGLEIILQTVLFSGFQKVINALQVVHNMGVSPNAIDYEREKQPEDRIANVKKGEDLLQLIYRKQYQPLRDKLRATHPDLEKLIVEWAYGRVLSRPCPELTPKERELCSIACLSGQIVFPQLHSHILGALNAGASLEEIRSIFDQTEYVWGRDIQAMVDGFWIDFAEHYKYKQKQRELARNEQKKKSENK